MIQNAPFLSLHRHRLLSDGDGITTLVLFWGCPLHCQLCINQECHDASKITCWMTPQQLYEKLKVDDVYFRSTGGGVVFGGGEPLLRYQFIRDFAEICNGRWKLTLETSLNVPEEYLMSVVKYINLFIVDIKDISPEVYESYTGHNNQKVLSNLLLLNSIVTPDIIQVRVPNIPGYNNEQNISTTVDYITNLGINNVEVFDYYLSRDTVNKIISHNRGKIVCEVLKIVRRTIAAANNISLDSFDCNNKGYCKGTCPRCEFELKQLSEHLWYNEKNSLKFNI